MDKKQHYESFLPQLQALIDPQQDLTSILANCAAAIHEEFGFLWTGFYLVRPDGQLHLGPFQGPVACYTIPFGRGVCGTAWQQRQTLVVGDVETFPGHIACSSRSRSEIVVPLFDQQGEVWGVLDIDSEHVGTFDETDRQYLEQAVKGIRRSEE